jgi:peptidoglycan/LPS O-acetylase OafA/YrhL
LSLTRKHRIFGLDVMRATAICMVVFAHSLYIFKDYNNAYIQFLDIFGFLGVEIFFVLSGFLIGGILFRLFASKEFSFKDLKQFWMRRWFRTLPLYFLFLLVNTLVALIVGYELPQAFWKYVFFLQNFSDVQLSFFPESWSLSVEEYSYLLAPIGIYLISKIILKVKGVSKAKVFLLTSLLFVVFCLLLKIIYNSHEILKQNDLEVWNTNLKTIVIYRLDAIFYGFILVYFFEAKATFIKQIRKILCFIGFILIFTTIILLPSLGVTIEVYPWYWNIIYLPLNSIAIALILPYLYYLKRPTYKNITQIITRISLYSYSMYLLHYTFLLYIMDLVIDFNRLDIFERIICLITYISTTYFGSKMIYKFFEKPITDMRDKFNT